MRKTQHCDIFSSTIYIYMYVCMLVLSGTTRLSVATPVILQVVCVTGFVFRGTTVTSLRFVILRMLQYMVGN